jgi:uncharacterized protein (TIGR02246 family)
MNLVLGMGLQTRLALCACTALLLIPLGCKWQSAPDTRKADEQTLRELHARWLQAASAKNIDAAIAMYGEDAVMLPPNAKMSANSYAIRNAWKSLLESADSLSWDAEKVEVARSGDLAYLIGTYRFIVNDPHGNPVADDGKFLEVWKKEADGNWKVAADMFSSDLRGPAPVPEKK